MKQNDRVFLSGFFPSWVKKAGICAVVAACLSVYLPAHAALTPTLSASQSGSSLVVAVSNADANASVTLYERQSSQYWATINNIGLTDSSGHFSTSLPLAWDGSSSPLQLYVTVNNAQSAMSYVYQSQTSSSGGQLSLSQTTLLLSAGQSGTVNAYPSSGSVSVSANSNTSVASYSINSNQITIYGIQAGTSTLTVCSSYGACNTVAVTVSGSTGSFVASPSSITLTVGQSSTVPLLNAVGTVYVSNNSNNSVASASLNGQNVIVTGLTAGTTTITACQASPSVCASLFVTVGGSGVSNGSGLSFSSSSVNLSVGQNQDVSSITSPSGSGTFYVASNSNSSAVNATINGSLLHASAVSTGTSIITVCQSGYNYCGTMTITVGNLSGNMNFSQSNVTLSLGQNTSIIVSGGSGSYLLSSNSNSTAVAASLSGNTLSITSNAAGQATLTVCDSSNTASCGTVTVLSGISSTGTLTFSTASPLLTVGQTQSIAIYSTNNYTGSYAISGNSNAAVANAGTSGQYVTLTGNASGSTFITVCESGSAICGGLTVSVSNASITGGPLTMAAANPPALVNGQYYSYQLQASGGTGSYKYSITIGTLPGGLTLTPGGLISGTPSGVVSSVPLTIFVVDSSGSGTASSVTLPISGTAAVTDNSSSSASAGSASSVPASISVPSTPSADSSVQPQTVSAYVSGQLIMENGTVYMVYKNTRSPFANAAAFTGLGFKFSNVTKVTGSGLTDSGRVVVTAAGAHPRGTWVSQGKSIYFVTPGGLIPVPDWNTFLSNGGQASFIVKATAYDLKMPKLSPMTDQDSRVK